MGQMIWPILLYFVIRFEHNKNVFSWSLPQFETMIDANDAINEDAYIVRNSI